MSAQPRPAETKDWRPHALARRLESNELDRMVEDYRSGDGCTVLGRRYGVSQNGVLAHLKRVGVALRAAWQGVSPTSSRRDACEKMAGHTQPLANAWASLAQRSSSGWIGINPTGRTPSQRERTYSVDASCWSLSRRTTTSMGTIFNWSGCASSKRK